MPYTVKEIFYTLQGEGANAGRAAVFCRFTGCNLWSGRERDRNHAICKFCDTDFVGTDGEGGGKFDSADALADAVLRHWPANRASNKFVVCTGGEPLLQLDEALLQALHCRDFRIAIETNGTIPIPEGVDWVCVSPKSGAPLVARTGDELKVVFPQGSSPNQYLNLQFKYFFIQPMDGPGRSQALKAAIRFCGDNPAWRLSLQTHKLIGIR
jgi:7-carboxy-7-deazaguanine synthase